MGHLRVTTDRLNADHLPFVLLILLLVFDLPRDKEITAIGVIIVA